MTKSNLPDAITAIVIEETNPLTFEELCHALQTENDFVIQLVEQNILTPHGTLQTEWGFDAYNFKRAKTAVSFYHDLDINFNGIALALDLLDEIERLKKTDTE